MTRCRHKATERRCSEAGDEATGRNVRAMTKRNTWFQAAKDPWYQLRADAAFEDTFNLEGYEGLFERRRGIPSPKRVPLATVDTMAAFVTKEQ